MTSRREICNVQWSGSKKGAKYWMHSSNPENEKTKRKYQISEKKQYTSLNQIKWDIEHQQRQLKYLALGIWDNCVRMRLCLSLNHSQCRSPEAVSHTLTTTGRNCIQAGGNNKCATKAIRFCVGAQCKDQEPCKTTKQKKTKKCIEKLPAKSKKKTQENSSKINWHCA